MLYANFGARVNTQLYRVQLTTDSGRSYFPNVPNDTFEKYWKPDQNIAMNDVSHMEVLSVLDTGLVILRTIDSGNSWHATRTAVSGYDHHYINGRLFALPEAGILFLHAIGWDFPFPIMISSDYGEHWIVDSSLGSQDGSKPFAPVNQSSYWLAFRGYDTLGRVDNLYHTVDRGQHWMKDTVTFRGYSIRNLMFSDSTHGWAIADAFNGSDVSDPYKAYVFRYSHEQAEVNRAVSQSSSFRVFPSPANEAVSIIADAPSKFRGLEVYNALGGLCHYSLDERTDSKIVLNIRSLPAGSYFVRIRTPYGRENVTFTKLK